MKYFLSELKYIVNNLIMPLKKEYKEDYLFLKKNGFLIKENFITNDDCNNIKKKIDSLIEENIFSWQDEEKSDTRIFGVERKLNEVKIFDQEINNELFKKYIGKKVNSFIMANKLVYKESNNGSGGGWHRDSINRKQLKFILYLTDVTEKNGCFQYLEKSHKLLTKFGFNYKIKKKLSNTRYTEKEISYLANEYNLKIKDFLGKKGTLLVVDTSGIHRGKPIEKESRYALTNYLFDTLMPVQITELLIK